MKKIITLTGLLVIVFTITLFTHAQESKKQDDWKPQNLKVLPQDISVEDLKSIMKSFNKALGVECRFCHTPKEGNEKELDFASDQNFRKEIARGMFVMTKEINANYFAKHPHDGSINQIACMTCHNGKEEPFSYKVSIDAK